MTSSATRAPHRSAPRRDRGCAPPTRDRQVASASRSPRLADLHRLATLVVVARCRRPRACRPRVVVLDRLGQSSVTFVGNSIEFSLLCDQI